MPKLKNVTAYYPRNTSLHESLAAKVITRVVSDGISLRNAIREAIKIAELNKKDIFLLLSVLQDFGMVQNGDYKNYWSNGWGEGIGTEGLDVNQGTNYYASNNQRVVIAETKQMFELFDQIEKMRAFASDEEIIEANPELEPVIASMQRTQRVVQAMGESDGPIYVSKDMGDEIPGEHADELSRLEDAFFGEEDLGFESEGTIKNVLIALAGVTEEQFTVLRKAMQMAMEEKKKGVPVLKTIQHILHDFPNINVPALRSMFLNQGYRESELGDLLGHVEPKQTPSSGLEHKYSPEGVEPKGMQELFQKQQQRQRQLSPAGASLRGRITVAVEEPAAGGLETLPEQAPATQEGELTVEEPEVTIEEGSKMNVEATPSPSELTQMAKEGPQWEINNMLSINKAEEYYNQLKKQLESVAFNPNIKMDLNGVSQYDKVRNMIDAELNKIKDAIKGKEKIEKKENKLEEEVKGENPELTVEEGPIPTEKAIAPESIEEAEPTTEGA